MNPRTAIEILGFICTGFVLMSFLVSGERRIRFINLVGAAISCGYGLLIHSPSVALLNGTLFIIHVYKLYVRKVTQ